MVTNPKANLRRWAYRLTIGAHIFGLTAIVLMVFWLSHYQGGINVYSHNEEPVFNVHPFLMIFGFVFFAGQGAMAYMTIQAEKSTRKLWHLLLNAIPIVLGFGGIYAAFKYHNMLHLKHMTSFHSWFGLATFCIFSLQWLFGFVIFMYPQASPNTRARTLPWHICIGRALLYTAICTAETGLMQKITSLNLENDSQSRLINFIALAILLFGIAVDLSIALPRY